MRHVFTDQANQSAALLSWRVCDLEREEKKEEEVSADRLSLMWFYSQEASEAKADCWERTGKVSAEYLRV